jgi:hypothetical protein
MLNPLKIVRIQHWINDVTRKRKEKATGAAAHRILKRVEGKRVRLTNEQKAEIAAWQSMQIT